MASLSRKAREFLSFRRTVYVRTFANPNGEEVLRDLARFCRAHQSTFAADSRAHAVAEGRREVWLRIQHQLRLSDDDIWVLYGVPIGKPNDE